DNLSAVTTVGGIDAADALNVWWRSYVERTVKALNLADIGAAYRAASRGPEKPDVAFTTDLLHASFEAQLQPQQRFTNPKAAEVGFENLLYKQATVMTDADAAVGDFTFLNTRYIKLIQHSNRWLTPTTKDSNPGTDAYYQHIISMGQLVISNRKLGGARLEARTA
ncbi:MAG: phage major capsid protein, partial [Gemmatimonadota bacterium]|nr:phage major capsid protein [Gemmatimonadota bacterium]